jgi:protein ImuA
LFTKNFSNLADNLMPITSMPATKADIIHQLQKEILALQGFKGNAHNRAVDAVLGPIKKAFHNNSFPAGAVHEFIYKGPEATAATSGFVSGLVAALMKNNGVTIWMGSNRHIFPPALTAWGIAAEKVIFIELKKEKQLLWAMEEALKCNGLAAVVAEIPELSFTASRRLQLAVEKSQVTGFILRHQPKMANITSCVTRWQVYALPSVVYNSLPGVGFPRWQVDLLKVRNGKPGSWQVDCIGGRFVYADKVAVIPQQLQQKTG